MQKLVVEVKTKRRAACDVGDEMLMMVQDARQTVSFQFRL